MSELNLKEIEEKWRKYWEKEKIYKTDLSRKKIYSIDTPPPTVSGKMHIGHAFSYSQQDFIVRFWRMFLAKKGNVFYPFGTDDNGLPTERLIEKTNNIKSKDISRTEFIELCLKTLKQITPDFIQDWKNLGVSCDYDIYYSTIDKNSQKISQKSFIELYKKGIAYRKEFPVIWCPECQTSIAQAELEDKELITLFSTLKFKCEGKDLLIATTRPELLGACVAVFVNPNDKRYKKLIGKKAKVPLFDFEVPIFSDSSAEIKKGTGILMVCSYGDKYDVSAINKHKLKPRIVLNQNGTIKEGKYKGLKINEARTKILEDLKKNNLIEEQKEISHAVNVHDRCGTEIEFLPAEQWFIKILDKKKKWIEQGKKINWHPDFMYKRYENWIKGLEWDWNISRNRHFGIPIPIWYCKNQKCRHVIVADEKELPIDPLQVKKKCPKCNSETYPEEKVLDTWATSSLTPQIASSLIKNKVVIPYSLRPQAHDIIRTWAFYTIVKSYLHEKKLPWKNIMISGYVTLNKEKMSKSKGNVILPQEVINKFCTDALRFGAAGSKPGEDADYQEKDILLGKKFVIKLLNASRFVFINLKNYKPKKPKKLEIIDKLFLEKLNSLIKKTTDSFQGYNYSKARLKIEDFFWHVFCDNYLEIIKWRVYNGNKQEKESAFYTLYNALLTIIKLVSPITPFITEEIYQNHFKNNEKEKSIHVSSWPAEFPSRENKKEGGIFELLVDLISRIRQEKTKAKKSMNSEVFLTLDKKEIKKLKPVLNDLSRAANILKITEGKFKIEFK